MIHIKLLFKRIGIILLLFTICRLLFFLINGAFFADSGFYNWMFIFIHGIRFDLSAIVYIQLPFILFHIIPIPHRKFSWYQRLLKYWFLFFTGFMVFTNLADIIYFQYTFKRATADVLDLMFLGDDFFHLVPQFLSDFWYLFIIWLVLLYRTTEMYKATEVSFVTSKMRDSSRFLHISLFILLLIGLVIAGRGGFQLKPIGIINAGAKIESQNIPMVLNTPFSIMTTFGKNAMYEVDYYKTEELNKVFNPVFEPFKNKVKPDSNNTNVVIIIMESFSSEYSGFFSNQNISYMPFLDSLSKNSLAFTNCFANGKKSIEGIPAILGGCPSLMDNPYITSSYAGNRALSIAGHLKKIGYASYFYHGGNNGTMGFDSYAHISGFENYVGRNEYNIEGDYDGNWGIYDDEFFQFFVNGLENTKKPFVGCFVSLSSHHPYAIPEKHNRKFKIGTLEIHPSVQYADYSLKRFFKTASKMDWFNNTLFVITADHTGITDNPQFKNKVGMYSIPLVFFHPGSNLKGVNSRMTQQIDIMPSILNYIGFDKKFIAYGSSVFDTKKDSIAFNYLNGVYQIFQDNYVLQFDGEKSISLYNYEKDPLLETNLIENEQGLRKIMEDKIKAVIQSYNSRLINNQMVVD